MQNQKIELILYRRRQIARLLAGIYKTDHVKYMSAFLNLYNMVPLTASCLSCWAPFGATPQHSITSGYIWVVFERQGLPKVIRKRCAPDQNLPKGTSRSDAPALQNLCRWNALWTKIHSTLPNIEILMITSASCFRLRKTNWLILIMSSNPHMTWNIFKGNEKLKK